MPASSSMALRPASVPSSPPMRTRSGYSRSLTAVPSARNSGLESTWNSIPVEERICLITSAVRTGSVDFSTTIFPLRETSAILRAQLSTNRRSDALPAPYP